MDSNWLEAPRSSNKVRKRTISSSLNSDTVLEILEPYSNHVNNDTNSSSGLTLSSTKDSLELTSGPNSPSERHTPKASWDHQPPSSDQHASPSSLKQIRRNMSLPADDHTKQSLDSSRYQTQDIADNDVPSNHELPINLQGSSVKYIDGKQQHKPAALGTGRGTGQQRAKSDFGVGNISKRTEWIEEMDALKIMKDGTSFLKYGKWGAPHFRPFRLSQDHSKIIWSSKNKSKDSTQIDIKRIDKILLGQNTATFQRHASPELARASFSVIYDKFKTLDVVAKNQTDHNCWIQGLNALIEASRKEELEQLSELIVRLKMTKVDSEKDNDAKRSAKPKCSKEFAIKDLTGLLKVYNALEEKSQSPKMIGSEEFEIVSSKLESLKNQLDLIENRIEANEIGEIDFLLWQASVEIESLDNILVALKI